MSSARAITAAVVGAVVGGVVGYLFLSEDGRRLRRQIEPAIDDVARELTGFGITVQKAAGVVAEGWNLLNETLGETEPVSRYPGRQTSPF